MLLIYNSSNSFLISFTHFSQIIRLIFHSNFYSFHFISRQKNDFRPAILSVSMQMIIVDVSNDLIVSIPQANRNLKLSCISPCVFLFLSLEFVK